MAWRTWMSSSRMRGRFAARSARGLRVGIAALLFGVTPPVISAQTVQVTPLSAPLPKACWPTSMLRGRDTVFYYLPCNSLEVLEPRFRKGVECTLAKLKKGGWRATVYETYRSDARQRALYAQGRTRPGPKVTNASSAVTTVHFYGLAVDVIDARKGWDNPRFFYWAGQHAESCGLVSGAFWKRLPDAPHWQTGAWQGAPPLWARSLAVHDSLFLVWRMLP